MQLLLDNLTATIVAGILILGLQTTQIRSQHASIEQVASHSVKAKTLVFGKWVERDILDLGANFGSNLYRFGEPSLDAQGNTQGWAFYSNATDGDGDPVRIMKRYRLESAGTKTFRDTTFQVYRLDRDSLVVDLNEDGTTAPYSESDWVPAGQSLSTLSFFQIDLLDRVGETPRDADGDVDVYKVDYVRVRFGVVPEYALQPDNYLRELYWAKTLKVRPYWVPPPTLSS